MAAGRSLTRSARNIAWIEKFCRVPEGRDVGKPVRLRDWQRNELARIYDNPHGTRRAILSFGRKNGKGLALDTPIPTPGGWTTIGQLRPGDSVFGSDGLPTRVRFVSDVHVGLRCWRLTFSDGSTVVADEQHQWLTRHSYRPWADARKNGSGFGGRWREEVVTTPQIAASVLRPRRGGGTEHNHKIACAPPLENGDVSLSVDPYVLGAWLGDGSSACAVFTVGGVDLDHMAANLARGLGGALKVRQYGAAHTLCTPGLGLQSRLRALGVLGNKHIPEMYLSAGTAQRWALLQGLMDTDGTVTRCGGRTTPRASFTSCKEQLARGAWRLARSLGLKATLREGRATLRGRDIGPKFEVSFSADRSRPVFRLPRKQGLLPEALASRSSTLSVIACEEVESVPTVCIQVEAKNSLFLAGYGCVPTHNTAISSFILLLHLCGPEARPNSQLYSAAQSRDQAAILFALAAKIVRMSPELQGVVVVRDTAKQLFCPELGTLYRALSADASTAYGLSPVLAIHDELGQVRGPRSELYEALETATGAQDDPLSIVISTQAPTDADLLSVLIDDALQGHDQRVVVSLYSAPPDLDPFSEEAIKAANPAFGDFQNAKEVLAMASDAQRMPSRQAEFENLILNRRVEASSPFISRPVWDACGKIEVEPLDGVPVFCALDLSETADLTAFVMIGRIDGVWHVHPTFWLPGDGLPEKSRKDRVPYDVWQREGKLIAAPGKSVDYEYVAGFVREIFERYDVHAVGFDRWNWKHFRPWLEKAGFGEAELSLFKEVGQGFASFSPALRDLEADILNGRIAHGNHPVLSMCAANAVVQSDPAGNRKLSKIKSAGRIDGMVALTMAHAVADKEAMQRSVYEDRGVLTLRL